MNDGANNKNNRDARTGQYVDSKMDRACRCGHTLGKHTASRVAGEQPCLHEGCECESFKKVPK